MTLRMARPVRIKTSPSLYFRERIPADVIVQARGRTLSIPVGDRITRTTIGPAANEVKLSLRTSDPRTAKERQREVANHLAQCWTALRTGPLKLTHKQAVALAGEIYKDLTANLGDDPGSAARWELVREMNSAAFAGDYGMGALLIGSEARRVASLDERFGGFADAVLDRHGLHVDAESRTRLIEQVAKAADLAASRLQANAEGDYSPDAVAGRFDSFEAPRPVPPERTWDALLTAWAREAQPKQATQDQWRGYLHHLAEVTGVAGPAGIKREHVLTWKDSLVARGDTAKTVNDSKLACLKALLNWGLANGWVEHNAAQGVGVRQKAKPGTRMMDFSESQAAAILAAAATSTSPVYRWIPLLCALTGARVAEIAQLRKEDVQNEGGISFVRIVAAAGSVKNVHSERDVPLHPHIVESGFLAFVASAGKGPLFYDPAKRGVSAKKPQAKIVSKNVAQWVRKLDLGISRENRVDPNHGWRHWVTSALRRAGIADSVIDAIEGRAPSSVGHAYGSSDLRTKFNAIRQIPVPGASARADQAA